MQELLKDVRDCQPPYLELMIGLNKYIPSLPSSPCLSTTLF